MGAFSNAFIPSGVRLVMHSDISALALGLTSIKHPASLSVGDFYSNTWKYVDPEELPLTPRILTGGPSCKPFSASGKKGGGNNPLSSQLNETADLAHAMKVDAVLLENVDPLLSEDAQHGQFTICVNHFRSKGFHLAHVSRRMDSAFGGFSCRKRIFMWFESERMTALLPPAPPPANAPVSTPPRSIRELLHPLKEIPEGTWVQGTFLPLHIEASSPPPESLLPHKVGFLHVKERRATKGSVITLKTDSRKWRVIELRGSTMTLLLTDRLNPIRVKARTKNIKKIVDQKIPLFSIDGKSHSPRSWGEPPVDKVMMIWDTRANPPRARPLYGAECWRIMHLPSDDIDSLTTLGASAEDIGALAGNSIPREIILPSVAPIVNRIRLFDRLSATKTSSPTPLLYPFSPAKESVSRVVLLIVAVSKPATVYIAPDGRSFPAQDVQPGSRSSMVDLATTWATTILGPQASGLRTHGFLAAELKQALPHLPGCTSLVVVPTLSPPHGATLVLAPEALTKLRSKPQSSPAWCSINALAGSDLHEMAATAFFRVLSLTGSHCNFVQPRAWTTGALALAPANPRSVYTPSKVNTWNRCLDQMAVARDAALEALRSAVGPPELKSYLGSWVDRWTPLCLSEVPPALRANIPTFDHSLVRGLRFSRPCVPPTTNPYPRARPQRPVKGFHPTVISDILMPEAIRMMTKWVEQEVARLLKIRKGVDPGANPALAIGQGLFQPQARGRVWDLRNIQHGVISLMDFTADIETHLNRDFFSDKLKNFPDQELLSFIKEGVAFKADLELQLVLQPHLLSLGNGFASVQSELARLSEKGWYRLFSKIPFAPYRLMPQGATPRKYEDRWRRTTDGGAPRRTLIDSDGVEVIPLNVAASNDDPPLPHLQPGVQTQDSPIRRQPTVAASTLPKWPKEAKPGMGDVMHDAAILRSAADAAGEPLFVITDDFADFFNQLVLRASELWKIGLLTVPFDKLAIVEPVFISEQVLGFGLSPASNIAQRWAYAIMAMLGEKMDELEARHPPKKGSPLHQWTQQRTKSLGSKEGRLYFTHMYTDDPVMVVVGVDRMIRLLTAWHWLTTNMKAITAVAKKRNLGCSAKWLGSQVCTTLGATYIPPDKAIRAMAALSKVIHGLLTIEEWRSLLGLVEHLMWVKCNQRQFMYGMYEAFVAGGQADHGPAHIYKPSRLVINQCKRWIKIISTAGGATFTHALPLSPSPPHADAQYFLSSDAAKEGAPVPGLGGWAHGMWWELAIDERELLLPIAVLEFVAAAINFLTFAPFLRAAQTVVAEVDSLATAYALTQQSARSPLMVHVHNLLLANSDFNDLKPRLHVAHVYGEGNIMADAASRGMPDVLKAVASQLGVKLMKIEVPSAGRHILDSLTDFAGAEGLLMASQGAAPRWLTKEAPAAALAPLASPPGTEYQHKERAPPKAPPRRVSFSAPSPPPRRRARTGTELQLGQGFPADVPFQYLDTPTTGLIQRPCMMRLLTKREMGGTSLIPASQPVLAATLSSPAQQALRSPQRDATPRPTSFVPASPVPGRPGVEQSPPTTPRRPSRSLAAQSGMLEGEVDRLVSFISGDASEFALKPARPEMIQDLCQTSLEYVQLGSAIRTHYQESSQWRHWHAYCAHMGTPALRSDIAANLGLDTLGQQREVLLLAGGLPFIQKRMRGRSESGQAKPRSAYAVLLGVKRFHKRLGIKMVPFDLVLSVLKGLLREYIATHGPESLIPQRKEPFTVAIIRSLLNTPEGTLVNGTPWLWESPLGITMAAIFTTLAATAFRKDEIAVANESTSNLIHVITRSALRWSVDGRVHAVLSPDTLGLIREAVELGKKVFPILTAPPSKADQFGEYWSASPIYLPSVSSCELSAGARLLHLEVMIPCFGSHRVSTPLFPSSRGRPLTYATLDKTLKGLLTLDMSPEEAARYSFHSFRIFLACALLASGASREQIQSLCRWRGDSSVDIYARINPDDYVSLLNGALQADVSSIRATNLPTIDRTREVADLQEFLSTTPTDGKEKDDQEGGTPPPTNRSTTATPARGNHGHHTTITPASAQASTPYSSPGSPGRPSKLKKLIGVKLLVPQSEWPNEPDAPWAALVVSVRYNGPRPPTLWCSVFDAQGTPTRVSFSKKQVSNWRQ